MSMTVAGPPCAKPGEVALWFRAMFDRHRQGRPHVTGTRFSHHHLSGRAAGRDVVTPCVPDPTRCRSLVRDVFVERAVVGVVVGLVGALL